MAKRYDPILCMMVDEPTKAQDANKYVEQAIKWMKEGKDRLEILFGLQQMGLTPTDAAKYYAEAMTETGYKYQDKIYHVDSPLLGKFNVYNLACALLMCLSQGYEMEYLLRNVDRINVDGRLDIVDRGQGFMVMVDYAHTPNGIESLLDFVRTLDHNRIITVIGQAGERDTSKRKTVGSIVAKNSDIAIFCYEDPRGEDPKDIIDMMCEDIRDMDNYKIIIDRSEAIGYAIDIAQDGDMVLILGKGNETYQKMKDGEIYFNDEEEAIKYLDKKMNKILI